MSNTYLGSDDTRPRIPCRLCEKPTPMLGTKLCDGCWELERRIKADPDIARRILISLSERVEATKFIVIEIEDGGANAEVQTRDQVIKYLSKSRWWDDAYQIVMNTTWYPGDMLHYPCGWIFAVNDEVTL